MHLTARPQRRAVRVAAIGALVVAFAVAAYALAVLVVGVPGMRVDEGGGSQAVAEPTLLPLIPLLGAALVVVGVLRSLLLVAWAGLAVILAFAVLFLFGVGGMFLAPAAILLLLLAILHLGRAKAMPQAPPPE